MSKSSARSVIRLRGVRQNNLKNFDLDLPLNQLIVVTGLSGSGKSSLAFDTLFAEGQRRYIETFSPYARQFLDRMDKPKVDSIEGIPPAIAIEQRNSVRTTRSTVGTMTEICDYMKLLWPHVAQLHCRQCGRPVRKDSPQQIWDQRNGWKTTPGKSIATDTTASGANSPAADEVLITFELPLSDKLGMEESLTLVARQGYQRVLIDGTLVRIEDAIGQLAGKKGASKTDAGAGVLTVIQDRVKISSAARARFVEACEQAYHFGKGKLTLRPLSGGLLSNAQYRFSNKLHCAECDIEYRDPSPALFSFNHPVGACPSCRGFGRIISIDYELALPDKSKTLAQGAVKPWQTGQSAECQSDLLRMCRHFGVPTNVPFNELPKNWQEFVIEGEPGYGKDEEHEWPRAWYGIKGYFRWLESKAYKMHVRVLLSRYRAYTTCPACNGMRLQPDALLYRITLPREDCGRGSALEQPLPGNLTLADFYQLPIRRALGFVEKLGARYTAKSNDPLRLAFKEVEARLGFLNQVGLGYLTLDRPTRSLSGGETERVSLTTCLGTRLVNTLFVLDEPSVGLHPRDTDRLIGVLEQLRDAGNTVLVVEHEASVMRAADQIVDIGPGHGAAGGQVVFQGSIAEIGSCRDSLTGQYLSGAKVIPTPPRRGNATAEREQRSSLPSQADCLKARKAQVSELMSRAFNGGRSKLDQGSTLNEAALPYRIPAPEPPMIRLSEVTLHNIKNLSVQIPLDRFVCVTGVSGSGKTTLIRDVLLPLLTRRFSSTLAVSKASDRLDPELPEDTSDDDESESPGSGRARLDLPKHLDGVVLVDQSTLGKTPRSNPAVYIGAFEDIREVYAQSDQAKRRGLNASAFSFNSAQGQCERCRGAGFEKIEMQFLSDIYIRCPECDGRRYRAHILEIKLGRAPGEQALSIADLLDSTVEEAVDFLEGFPQSRPAARAAINLRLLQETGLGYLKLGQPINTLSGGESQRLKLVKHLAQSLGAEQGQNLGPARAASRFLFLFDEPTTGLHFDDVRVLLKVFQRLVDAGHSVVVIEHNLDVIKSCDWVIDLGPEAGDLGGQLVAEGTPEQVANCERSHTGQALKQVLSLSERLRAGRKSRSARPTGERKTRV
jgi:excinuclease ABC subunit A